MGREVRRVPADWQHPKKQSMDWRTGKIIEVYQPLFDWTFETRAKEWLAELDLWLKGEHESQLDENFTAKDYPQTITGYSEYCGDFPDREYYRPDWPEETMTHYQIYETVSEGTPVSPVFITLEALADWLVTQGYSRQAADGFAKTGWVPSMVGRVTPDGELVDVKVGIEIAGE